MYQFSYADVIEDSPATARSREREAVQRTIDMMKRAEAEGPQSMAAIEAILNVQRLWSLLIEDLARPENELPPQLRADLISIGLWIFREIDDIRAGKTKSFKALIEVSTVIAGGLT